MKKVTPTFNLRFLEKNVSGFDSATGGYTLKKQKVLQQFYLCEGGDDVVFEPDSNYTEPKNGTWVDVPLVIGY